MSYSLRVVFNHDKWRLFQPDSFQHQGWVDQTPLVVHVHGGPLAVHYGAFLRRCIPRGEIFATSVNDNTWHSSFSENVIWVVHCHSMVLYWPALCTHIHTNKTKLDNKQNNNNNNKQKQNKKQQKRQPTNQPTQPNPANQPTKNPHQYGSPKTSLL